MEDHLDRLEKETAGIYTRWTAQGLPVEMDDRKRLEVALVDIGELVAHVQHLIADRRACDEEVPGATLLLAAATHQAGGEILVRDEIIESVMAIPQATIAHFRDPARNGVSVRLVVENEEDEG